MRKTIEELTTQDDFMFGKAFEDIELAKELIDPAFRNCTWTNIRTEQYQSVFWTGLL